MNIPTNIIHPNFKHGKNFKIGEFNHIHEDVVVGDDVQIRSYVELRPQTIIGDGCYIDSGVKSSGQNKIGNGVILRYDAIIARNVIIEDDVFISPQVMFINIPFTEKEKKTTIIRKGAKIGTNATIGDGVEVGERVIIGAKAYVNKDCLEPGIYVGIPVRKLNPKIHPTAVIHSGAKTGKNVHIGANAVIGAVPLTFRWGGKGDFIVSEDREANVIIEDNVDIGAGAVIVGGMDRGTHIKRGAVIGHLCSIGHDSIIEEEAVIVTGTRLSGFVEVGEKSYIGLNCSVRNRVQIGKHVFIGMRSMVLNDVPDYSYGYGSPLKITGRTDSLAIKARLASSRLRQRLRRVIT